MTYAEANAAFDAAYAAMEVVRADFRAGKIDAAAFCAANAEFKKAEAAFDAAFIAESEREEVEAVEEDAQMALFA